jgi:hypothetical protein
VGSGETLVALPGLTYTVEYVLSRSHSLALEALVAVAAAELVASAPVLRLTAAERGGLHPQTGPPNEGRALA